LSTPRFSETQRTGSSVRTPSNMTELSRAPNSMCHDLLHSGFLAPLKIQPITAARTRVENPISDGATQNRRPSPQGSEHQCPESQNQMAQSPLKIGEAFAVILLF
jgi:hypothetical protein